MTCYYAFNGDADGLCALQQLRLVETQPATLVTKDRHIRSYPHVKTVW